MKTHVVMASLLALATFASSAHALTVTNEDKTAYTIKVTPTGGKEMNLALKASATSEIDCKMGCQLNVDGKVQDVPGTVAKIAIKAGKFVVM